MNTEVGGDLLDRHTVVAVAGHADDIVTELTGASLPTLGKPTLGRAREPDLQPRGGSRFIM